MAYWLLKTEPDTFSWNDQVKKGAAGEPWTGVRNFTARRHLKAMKKGDRAFFYHTGEERQIVGTVEVIREAYRDPTDERGVFLAVDVQALRPLRKPVTLAEVKSEPRLKDMALVKCSRLSVQPVTEKEWEGWDTRSGSRKVADPLAGCACCRTPSPRAAHQGRLLPRFGESAMTFAGVNYLAIVVAAVAAWLAGAGWYMVFGKTWMAAIGTTPEKMQEMRGQPGAFLPFIYAFVAELAMAWALAGILGHLGPGQVTVRNGAISALFLWLGFVIPTMLVNNSFAHRDWRLMLIDGGHWLVVLVLMGVIIGAIGV